nr:FAD-dependent monooxygenase [Pseudomonas sp.]
MKDADITILGAGPVGSALALLLARTSPNPSRIVLCHAWQGSRPAATRDDTSAPVAPRPGSGGTTESVRGPDPRSLALNHGSRVLLESLDAWPQHGAPIHTVHVSQRGRLGRTLIRDTDFGVPELGTVHQYGRVQDALHAALQQSGVTLREGDTAVIASQDADGATIAQADQTWRTAVVVQAEGGGFNDPADIVQRDYNQHAIITVVRAASPVAGWAWERFTREGPLALLPVHAGAPESDNNDLFSLVWCCTPERADALRNATDDAFSVAVSEAFGDRMGPLKAAGGQRHIFPLQMRWKREVVEGRRVAIGNAAQTLHPVAGQGLNLGLRDAAQLAQRLGPWQQAPGSSPDALLRQFAQARRSDRLVTAGITDLLPRVFATGWSPLEHACGLALLALDAMPVLRRPLARQLMRGLRI